MPGYVIHLSIANEYMSKHKIDNKQEFMEGTVYPDDTTDKRQTHYAKTSSTDTDLYQFLIHQKLDSDFKRGWFLHLFADYLFYNHYFSEWRTISFEILYRDYDILNPVLIEKYKIDYIPKGKEKFFTCEVKGDTVAYHYEKIIQFIEDISNYNLEELAEKILRDKNTTFLFKSNFS